MKKPAKKTIMDSERGTFMLFDNDVKAEDIVKTVRKHAERYERRECLEKTDAKKK
jgi:hypothetical protein